MSSRLSSMLVQQGLVSVGALQDALALQVVRGGTLDTVLLERDLVAEEKLIQLLSEIMGYPPIEPETLDHASPAVAGEIPEKTAKKIGICPVMREDDRLLVVSSEATDQIALPELAYELNCVIVPTAATELRVEQACSIVYGADLSPRFAELVKGCGERPPQVAWTAPVPLIAAEAPEEEVSTTPTDKDEHTEGPGGDSHTASPEETTSPGVPRSVLAARANQPTREADGNGRSRATGSRTPTDRFPFVVSSIPLGNDGKTQDAKSIEAASEGSPAEQAAPSPPGNATALAAEAAVFELERASDREEVLITLLRAAHNHLAVLQLYAVVKQQSIVGRYRLEDQALDATALRDVRVALPPDSQLMRCVQTGSAYIGPTPDADATIGLLQHLGLDAPHIAIIPVRLRDRTVCLIVGHRRTHTIPHTVRTPLERLATAGANALGRLIVRKKRRTAEIEAEQKTTTPAKPPSMPGDDRPAQVSGEIADPRAEPAHVSAPALPVAAPPPAPHEKVIVDFDVSIATRPMGELVRRLDEQPELAEDILAEIRRRTKSAMQWLLDNFPGKLRFSRSQVSELPDVSECSAVLQALVTIGRPVVARLAPLLVGGDEQARFFATYLLSELTYPETVSLLAHRLRDPSLSVRQAAIYGLRRSRELEQFPLIVEELRADLSHPDTRPQLAAMEALAALGDVVATPSLIALLNDDRADLAKTAHRALVQLTKADFGRKPQPWMTWWNRNRHRHRVEWMIDGLINDEADIRDQAFVELRDLTSLDFGYSPDLPTDERDRIRHQFLQWWTDTGLYDFGRFA